MSTEAHAVEAHESHERPHPGPGEYIKVAVVLAFVTAIEVGAYYLKGIPRPVFSLLLIMMMTFKFALVGLWFMHLRFDNPVFRRLFTAGIILAMLVYFVAFSTLGLQHTNIHGILHFFRTLVRG